MKRETSHKVKRDMENNVKEEQSVEIATKWTKNKKTNDQMKDNEEPI